MNAYFDGNVDNAWQSVWVMCELFERESQFVGEKLGWEYNEKEGKAVQSFLEYVYRLSKNK